jgi:hypothetical protein
LKLNKLPDIGGALVLVKLKQEVYYLAKVISFM